MKKLFTLGLILILIGLVMMRQDDIITLVNTYLRPSTMVSLNNKNEYYRNYDFEFVKNTENFSPNSFQDILNIYYTVINAGETSFSFYCPKEYEGCLKDIQILANDQDKLSDINNYVHPFNGFSHIETEYDQLGKVTINIVKSYKKEDIEAINAKIDELYPKLVNDKNTNIQNIKSIHDYIINNTIYDSDRSDKQIIKYRSDIAYGPLFEGHAICGGYTDLMELFLEKLNIRSFKVSSDDHIWNAVNLDGKWYHLDLTWDDPVANDGKNYLEHTYFLVDTKTLLKKEKTQHIFNQETYPELKEAY